MADKLRKLKDEAAKLVQKGKLDKALAAYQEVLKLDPKDLTAQLRCGDLLRKLGRDAEAIDCYNGVALVYAEDGLLLKAIAACKLILEIDSDHTATQTMLADLYAKKTGRAAAASHLPTVPAPVSSAAAAPPPMPAPQAPEIEEIGDEDILIEDETSAAVELPTIPLFSDLPKNAFIQLMESMSMRSVLPDEVIIAEGDTGDSMFIVSNGQVKVTKTVETGEELVLARLGDGAFFGEMALLSDSPRSASVIAEEETLLFQVSRDVLAQVVKNFPSVRHILLRFYRQRLLANLMATSSMFRPLDAEQRRSLIEKFKSRELDAQTKILEQEEKGDGLYVLLSGQCEVSVKAGGKRKVVAHLKGGDVFGESSLLNNAPCNATVKTIKKSIILKLPRRAFGEIVSTHPQLIAHIAELSGERQKTTEAILKGQLDFSEEGLVVV